PGCPAEQCGDLPAIAPLQVAASQPVHHAEAPNAGRLPKPAEPKLRLTILSLPDLSASGNQTRAGRQVPGRDRNTTARSGFDRSFPERAVVSRPPYDRPGPVVGVGQPEEFVDADQPQCQSLIPGIARPRRGA